MKKIFSVGLILVLTLTLAIWLIGCDSDSGNYEQARQDLMAHLEVDEDMHNFEERFAFYEINSRVFVSALGGTIPAEWVFEMAGYDFVIENMDTVIHAWIDGEIYLLSCAYECGVITDEDVSELHRQFVAD